MTSATGAQGGQSSANSGTMSSTASGSGGGPGANQVPVVVAQGYVGRTTISCDDGKTWIANRSFDIEGHALACGDTTPVRCGVTACKMPWTDGTCGGQEVCDCVHGTGYGKGVAIGQNQVLANFGWGWPGAVLRSADGGSWSVTLEVPMALHPDIAFGADRFVRFSAFEPVVSDDGVMWAYPPPVDPNKGARASAFLDYEQGRFIAVADGDDIWVSDTRGDTWREPTSVPPGCGKDIGQAQKILTGNGIAVLISYDDRIACRSGDGGDTWTKHPITDLQGGVLFATGAFLGGKFLVWAKDFSQTNNIRYASDDGITWTETPTLSPIWIGSLGVTSQGTLIVSHGAYEEQSFSRSTDEGLTWTKLPLSAFVQSHAVTRFGAGYVESNTLCP